MGRGRVGYGWVMPWSTVQSTVTLFCSEGGHESMVGEDRLKCLYFSSPLSLPL